MSDPHRAAESRPQSRATRTLRNWFDTLSTRLKRIVAGITTLIIAVLVSASIFATGPSPSPEERSEKAWPVSVISVTPTALSPIFATYGRVESRDTASLDVDVIARVDDVLVHEGQWVSEGDLLIKLDDTELALQLDERTADLALARAALSSVTTEHAMQVGTTKHYEELHRLSQKKLERHRELYEQRMIARSIFDEAVQQASSQTITYQTHMRALADFPNRIAQAKANVAKSEALAGRANLDLAKTRVVAPFDGPVLQVNTAEGNTTRPGAPLLTIAGSDRFRIRAPIADRYARRLNEHLDNATPIFAYAVLNGTRTKLPLTQLAGNVRIGQGGLDAFFALPIKESHGLPEIGRVLDVEIWLPPEPDVIALPVQAIYENDRIYRMDNNRLQAVTVDRIGEYRDSDGNYQVLVRSNELNNNAQVITTQLPRAISGLLVETIGAATPAVVAGSEG